MPGTILSLAVGEISEHGVELEVHFSQRFLKETLNHSFHRIAEQLFALLLKP
jgi:hypothetical protein